MQWEMLGCMLGIFGAFTGLMLWMMARMENRLDAHMTSSEHKWIAMNARIDVTQAAIMRMLEKQGK